MSNNDSVGRGHPPRHARFKPGRSGNPSGRPKKAPTVRSDLLAELEKLVPGADGERISKQRALVRMLLKTALGGDLRAVNVLLSILGRTTEQSADAEDLSDHDVDILKGLAEREQSAPDQRSESTEEAE
jgi:hypothetical protein